jgi:peptide/nickel transport system permease protein
MAGGRAFRRLLEIAATMLAVSAIVYAVLEVDASDVAVKVLGPYSTVAQRQLWLHENGYDAPFAWRYLVWLAHFISGDWGQSVHYREQVLRLVRERLAATALLAGLTLAVTVPLSFVLGIAAGAREGSVTDRVVSFFCVLATSVPEYASAAFLSGVFVFWLGWLPGASTMMSGFAPQELVLPVSVLVIYASGYLARITRAAMVETMSAPYIRTAMMKGASPGRIILRHALRNALIAPVTVVMLYVPWLLSGVIVVEVFFSYPGFGSLLYEAAMNSDITLIEGCAMVSVVVVVGTQLLSEVLYAALNPRLRHGRRQNVVEPTANLIKAAE